jgi:hypothetical protein
MNSIRKVYGTLAIVAASLALASAAQAYDYGNWCNGEPYKKNGSLGETRNACSFDEEEDENGFLAYFSSIIEWNNVSSKAVTASKVRPREDCTIDLDDDLNEIARVTRSQIDGNNGLTTYANHEICIPLVSTGNLKYTNTDVRIANDMRYEPFTGKTAITRSVSNVSAGQLTLIHEIGHQLNLGHFHTLNTMNDSSQYPVNGPNARPFPDDVAGAAALNGSKARVDLFPSSQRFGTSGVIDIFPSDVQVCRGQTPNVTLRWTVANVGNTNLTFDQSINLLRTTNPVGIIWLNWLGGTVNKRGHFTWSASVAIPSLAVGTYRIFHNVDITDRHDEHAETDNQTEFNGRLVIVDC